MPYLIFEKFGQAKPIPANSTQSIKFRRYFLDQSFITNGGKYNPMDYFQNSGNMNPTVKVLTEGQTPNATSLKSEDISATLTQYGDLVSITDVIMDTHEDPILREVTAIMGEQAAVVIEKTRFNVLKAGTNVFYANGSARNAVNTAFTGSGGLAIQRKVVRQLKRNLAKPITSVIRSTAAYATQNVNAGYVAVCHPDCEGDIRGLTGFVSVENYGSMPSWDNEIGKVEDVRYIMSTVMEPWMNAGGAAGSMITTGGTSADVYPILFFAKDAYGIVPFKGASAVTPIVVNPKPCESDPLGQRGHVGWKAYQATVILNEAWMCRVETAATA